MELEPIGVVHSPVTDTHEMPPLGVLAQVEVYPQYAAGLLDFEINSHVVVVSWMHLADRNTLQVKGIGPDNLPLQKGVFAIHSPARPNPLAISTSRLLKVEGRRVFLERLDMIDGTSIVDMKGYTPSGDCIFSARSYQDYVLPSARKRGRTSDLVLIQAEHFHGRRCVGVGAGAKLVTHVSEHWDVAPRDDELVFVVGEDGRDAACTIDSIMGSTGATFGNGRLALRTDSTIQAYCRGKILAYMPRWSEGMSSDSIADRDVAELFEIQENRGIPDGVEAPSSGRGWAPLMGCPMGSHRESD